MRSLSITFGKASSANLLLGFCYLLIMACSTNPTRNFERAVDDLQLTKKTVSTKQFDLRVYENRFKQGRSLHVYIGGDGKPWLNHRYKSKDPTPRRLTALSLMQLDTRRAIYLGRPCYHHNGIGRNCSDKWWTSHRYAQAVVDSLSEAVKQYIIEHDIQTLTLIGHSGGGTLAMLLAPSIAQTTRVVTISGNLDTDAWTTLHLYTPLTGSLNPARMPELSSDIKKVHLLGGQDKNIPVEVISHQYHKRKNTKIIHFPDYTHHCCWQDRWLGILNEVKPEK